MRPSALNGFSIGIAILAVVGLMIFIHYIYF